MSGLSNVLKFDKQVNLFVFIAFMLQFLVKVKTHVMFMEKQNYQCIFLYLPLWFHLVITCLEAPKPK